jgi:hypothetical protein
MFLVVNDPEEQEFSLKKIKISADSGIWLALAWNFPQFPDFFHEKFLLFGLVCHQKHV